MIGTFLIPIFLSNKKADKGERAQGMKKKVFWIRAGLWEMEAESPYSAKKILRPLGPISWKDHAGTMK